MQKLQEVTGFGVFTSQSPAPRPMLLGLTRLIFILSPQTLRLFSDANITK